MRYLATAAACCSITLLSYARPAAAAAPDLVALFREDMQAAAAKVGRKAGSIDDDLALAVAASGLVAQPSVDGMPLLRTSGKSVAYTGWQGRVHGYRSAVMAGRTKDAVSYAVSLILEPERRERDSWLAALSFLASFGDGLDHILTGVLSAPDNTPLLSRYRYAAADALVWCASASHLPILLILADSPDAYLRSRAITALGRVGFSSTTAGATTVRGLLPPVQERGIGAAQRRMIENLVLDGLGHYSYRVRAASAVAAGLTLGPEAVERLERLARDPAYLKQAGPTPDTYRIVFPVRDAAAAALQRTGRSGPRSGVIVSKKELRQATRGGRDVTRDTRGIRKDLPPGVPFYEGDW